MVRYGTSSIDAPGAASSSRMRASSSRPAARSPDHSISDMIPGGPSAGTAAPSAGLRRNNVHSSSREVTGSVITVGNLRNYSHGRAAGSSPAQPAPSTHERGTRTSFTHRSSRRHRAAPRRQVDSPARHARHDRRRARPPPRAGCRQVRPRAPHQPAERRRQRQPPTPVRHHADRHNQTVRLCLTIDVAEQRSALDTDQSPRRGQPRYGQAGAGQLPGRRPRSSAPGTSAHRSAPRSASRRPAQ